MGHALSSWGRGLFGLCLLLSWANSASNALSAERLPYQRGIRLRAPVPWNALAASVAALTCVFLAADWAFTFKHRQGAAGLAAFALLGVIRRIEVRQWPEGIVIGLGKYVPAAAVLGAYLVAYLAAAGWPQARREACGWEAGCGVIGAAYALSAWAKHKEAGADWLKSGNLGLLIAERSYDGPRLLRALRAYAVASPRLCSGLAAYSLVAEWGGALFVVPQARWALAALLTALQVGITALLGYVEAEWIAVVLSLAMATAGGAAS